MEPLVFTTYAAITILTAGANLYAASNDFRRVDWILASVNRLQLPHSQLFMLGALKAAGALGLLVGFAIPWIGVVAAAGLVLFFLAAIAFALRVRWYEHLPFPAVWLLFAVGALILRVITR
jgi:hypothetical protein